MQGEAERAALPAAFTICQRQKVMIRMYGHQSHCVHAIGGIMFNAAKRLAAVWVIALGLALIADDAIANASCPNVGFTIVEPHASSETRPVRVGSNQVLFVHREPITRTSDILEIKLVADGDDDASLLLKFTPAATQRLHDATTNHSGRRIAFMFDDEVLNNVVWEGPYGLDADGAQVSIRHGLNQSRRLMRAIQGCTAATAGDRARPQ
jgi:hypothetical protein